MLEAINLKSCLLDLISAVARWIKRDRTVTGPVRAIADVIDGGGSDPQLIGKLCVVDEQEYFVNIYHINQPAETPRVFIRHDAYRIVESRTDQDQSWAHFRNMKTRVLNDNVPEEYSVKQALQAWAKREYATPEVRFEDRSLSLA